MLGTQVRIERQVSRLGGETALSQAKDLCIRSRNGHTDCDHATSDRMRSILGVLGVVDVHMSNRLDADAVLMLQGAGLVRGQYQRDQGAEDG